MKNTATKTATILKAIDRELKAMLEADIRKFNTPQYAGNKNAAFLQFITA